MRKSDPAVKPLADQGRPNRVPSYLALYPSSLLTREKKRELGIKRESLHWILRHSLFCICIRTFWRRRDFRFDGITPAPPTARPVLQTTIVQSLVSHIPQAHSTRTSNQMLAQHNTFRVNCNLQKPSSIILHHIKLEPAYDAISYLAFAAYT